MHGVDRLVSKTRERVNEHRLAQEVSFVLVTPVQRAPKSLLAARSFLDILDDEPCASALACCWHRERQSDPRGRHVASRRGPLPRCVERSSKEQLVAYEGDVDGYQRDFEEAMRSALKSRTRRGVRATTYFS